MSGEKSLPVNIVVMRAEEYTDDGASIVISFKTRHSAAERRYSVPIECFRDLIRDLQRLNTSAEKSADSASVPVPKPEDAG